MLAAVIRIDSDDQRGAASPLFLASVDDESVCHLNGYEWEPAIERLPRLRYDFFGGAFGGKITAPSADFTVSVSGARGFLKRTYSQSRVRIWQGQLGASWSSYRLKFDGEIESEPEVKNGTATFNASPNDEKLDEPFLDVFAGTGTIEGPDDLTGQVKPRVFGNARFAPGVLIDRVDLVYLINDGPVEAVNAVYDRAATLGASTGDYADWDALLAADIPPGGWGTCHALGLVRLGAPPDGKVAFDVSGDNADGYVRKPGEMISRIASIAGVTIDAENLSELDAAVPFNQVRSEATQTTARQIIQSIADGIGAAAGVTFLGKLYVQPLGIDEGDAVVLAADGSSDIAVDDISARAIGAPFWRIATYAEPTFVVYSQDEIATGYNLRGEYNAAREYRLDDAVFTADGRTFVYVADTPSSGNAPPDYPDVSNAWWSLEGAADNTAGSQITFAPTAEFVVQADAQGITTTTLPLTRVLRLQRGGVSLTSGVTWVIDSETSGLSSSIGASDGVLSLDDADVSGEIVVTASLAGAPYKLTVPVRRSTAAAPVGGGSGGSSFTDTVLTNVSTTTPVKVTDGGVIVQSDGSGEIQFTLFAQYQGTGAMTVQAKISSDNTTFTDVGSSTTGTPATPDTMSEPGEIGFVSLNVTATGLTPNTDYYPALFANRATGTGSLPWQNATFTAKHP